MCEFCIQHGEGKTWYLNTKNYSTELLADLDRRHFIGHFYHDIVEKGNRQMLFLEKGWMKAIGLPRFARDKKTRDMKESHFGQVVPLEDVEKILAMAQTITRVACGCKWAKEKKEGRFCYGITLGANAWYDYLDMDFFGSPDLTRMETLEKHEALRHIRETDEKGMVHSIWTFKTPFIGAICNCESSYCLAMRSTVGQKMPAMFKAEYVAAIDPEVCLGCRSCIEKCAFSAIEYDENGKNCRIDLQKCFGCGVCRAACPDDAINLRDRKQDPIASLLW